jgi:hypothetical protein
MTRNDKRQMEEIVQTVLIKQEGMSEGDARICLYQLVKRGYFRAEPNIVEALAELVAAGIAVEGDEYENLIAEEDGYDRPRQ